MQPVWKFVTNVFWFDIYLLDLVLHVFSYDNTISDSVDDGSTVQHWCKCEWRRSHTGWAPHIVIHSVTHRQVFGVNMGALWS